MTNFTPFDAADYLGDDETIAAYLNAALEEDDPDAFLAALKTIARARGMTQLAKDTGLGRESLYKALSGKTQPKWDTVQRIIKALHITLHVA